MGVVVEYLKTDKDKAIFEKCDLELLKGIKSVLLELEMYNDIIIIDELINKYKWN